MNFKGGLTFALDYTRFLKAKERGVLFVLRGGTGESGKDEQNVTG